MLFLRSPQRHLLVCIEFSADVKIDDANGA